MFSLFCGSAAATTAHHRLQELPHHHQYLDDGRSGDDQYQTYLGDCLLPFKADIRIHHIVSQKKVTQLDSFVDTCAMKASTN
jgi:hypothetical protein